MIDARLFVFSFPNRGDLTVKSKGQAAGRVRKRERKYNGEREQNVRIYVQYSKQLFMNHRTHSNGVVYSIHFPMNFPSPNRVLFVLLNVWWPM